MSSIFQICVERSTNNEIISKKNERKTEKRKKEFSINVYVEIIFLHAFCKALGITSNISMVSWWVHTEKYYYYNFHEEIAKIHIFLLTLSLLHCDTKKSRTQFWITMVFVFTNWKHWILFSCHQNQYIVPSVCNYYLINAHVVSFLPALVKAVHLFLLRSKIERI